MQAKEYNLFPISDDLAHIGVHPPKGGSTPTIKSNFSQVFQSRKEVEEDTVTLRVEDKPGEHVKKAQTE